MNLKITRNEFRIGFISVVLALFLLIYIQTYLIEKEKFNLGKIKQFIKDQTKIKEKQENGKSIEPAISNDKWIVTSSIEIKSNIDKNEQFLKLTVDYSNSDERHERNQNQIVLNQKLVNSLKLDISKNGQYDPKNIAYLFAIKNGAEFIVDSESLPSFDLSAYFIYDLTDYGLIYDCNCNSSRVINPFAHFGQPLLNQRGNFYNQEVHLNSYYVGKRKTSAIQHAILNGWPDLSNQDAISIGTVEFDNSAPNFQLPIGKMAPFNSRLTLFRHQAFWALYLPTTVPYSDIYRSFWSQRLMWLIDETVSFIGPKSNYMRTKSNKIDVKIEKKVKSLVDFLYEWKCTKSKFFECVIELSVEMAIRDYWSNDEVGLINDWLNDLKRIGYKEPIIVNFEQNKTNSMKEKCQQYNNPNAYSKVRFTPKFQKTKVIPKSFRNNTIETTIDKLETFLHLDELCQSCAHSLQNISQFLSNPYSVKSNYTLLVTFNLIIFTKNIPLLIHFFGNYFQNIIFCGLNIIDVLNSTRGSNREYFDSYTFIEFDSHNGYFHYFCMNKAIQMNYQTEGILLASDDVVIKPWNLHKLDTSKIWFPEPLFPKLEFKQNAFSTYWMWWDGNYPSLVNLFNFLNKSKSGESDKLTLKETSMINEYLSVLDSHRVNKSYVSFGGSDIFYLPKNKFEIFRFMSQLFKEYGIFLEIAVPTILIGIDRENDSVLMNGIYKWGVPFDLGEYDKAETFGHPFKLSGIRNNPVGARFCKLFIQEKININI